MDGIYNDTLLNTTGLVNGGGICGGGGGGACYIEASGNGGSGSNGIVAIYWGSDISKT